MVRHLRLESGLTQSLLSQLSGISQSSISEYERGQTSPTLETLSRLAAAADLELEVSLRPSRDRGIPALDTQPSPERVAGSADSTKRKLEKLWTI